MEAKYFAFQRWLDTPIIHWQGDWICRELRRPKTPHNFVQHVQMRPSVADLATKSFFTKTQVPFPKTTQFYLLNLLSSISSIPPDWASAKFSKPSDSKAKALVIPQRQWSARRKPRSHATLDNKKDSTHTWTWIPWRKCHDKLTCIG